MGRVKYKMVLYRIGKGDVYETLMETVPISLAAAVCQRASLTRELETAGKMAGHPTQKAVIIDLANGCVF